MLVLSRQRDETIMIGDEIEITIVDIRGDKVRLGITAPTRIAVHRKEVYEAIKRENEHAAKFQNGVHQGELDAAGRAVAPGPGKTRSRPASRLAARAEPAAPAPPGRPEPTRPATQGVHP